MILLPYLAIALLPMGLFESVPVLWLEMMKRCDRCVIKKKKNSLYITMLRGGLIFLSANYSRILNQKVHTVNQKVHKAVYVAKEESGTEELIRDLCSQSPTQANQSTCPCNGPVSAAFPEKVSQLVCCCGPEDYVFFNILC